MRFFLAISFMSAIFAPILSAAPTEHEHAVKHIKKGSPLKHRQSSYPFKQVVAFGDSLSDNGNGSWARGMVSYGKNPQPTIYGNKASGTTIGLTLTNVERHVGYRTWTNGPVAVSYLVDLLGVPLSTDYAVGHAQGGSKFGATINNTYTNSTAGAPDGFAQVTNYTSSGVSKADIASTLHFLWIGNMDISLKHIYVWQGFDYINTRFAAAMATQTASLVSNLLAAGATQVFVPNLYPRDLSPSITFMTTFSNGTVNPALLTKLTSTIALANAAIAVALAPFGDKVIQYDVNSFMRKVWQNHTEYGISHVGVPSEFCDGYSQEDWDLCVTQGKGDEFYWMQYIDPTTRVHQLIAQDMYATIKKHYGVN